MTKTKLPTNIQIFVDHLSVGLDSAGLDLEDFSPIVVKDRKLDACPTGLEIVTSVSIPNITFFGVKYF